MVLAAGALRLRPRAYVVGVLAIALNQMWLVQVELVRWSLFTNVVPFCNALFTLAVLLALNAVAGRVSPSRTAPLHRGELLAIFAMVCIGSALGAQQMGQLLVSFLPYPTRFADGRNRWAGSFVPHLPRWLTVSDPTAVRNFYDGWSSLYRPENWRPWVVPCLAWVLFTVVLLWTMLCLSALMRRQWTSAERLNYPTAQLPIEMTSGAAFWRSRPLAFGLAFAALLGLYNGAAYLMPWIPMIPIKRQEVQSLFVSAPWTGIGVVKISFYPFAAGLAFLMPFELSLSLWAFYLLYKLELVTVAALGQEQVFSSGAGFDSVAPYESAQAFGAYMVVCIMALWSGRRHLAEAWASAWSRRPGARGDEQEPMAYRTAFVGGGIGLLLLCAFLVAAGMPAWVALIFFVIYLALTLVIGRLRAEFGLPIHDMHNVGPANLLLASFGPAALGPRTLALFGLTYWFNRTYFANPLPHQLEGMKMADASGLSQRDLARAMMLAAAVGAVGMFWSYLHGIYQYGAATAAVEQWPRSFPLENFGRVHEWFQLGGRRNEPAMTAAGAGMGIALVLSLLRSRFAWFPFHPLGYAVANSWGLTQIWLPIMIGSVLKGIVMRYGGLRLYRSAAPFALGVILGDMLVGAGWTLVGIARGFRAYEFWP